MDIYFTLTLLSLFMAAAGVGATAAVLRRDSCLQEDGGAL